MTLTDDEIANIQHLPRDTPYLVEMVRHSQFSIARFGGGLIFNGRSYTYFPEDDTLIRDDVLRWVMPLRKRAERAARKAEKKAAAEKQGDML